MGINQALAYLYYKHVLSLVTLTWKGTCCLSYLQMHYYIAVFFWHHFNDFFQGYDTLHAVGVLVDFELQIFLKLAEIIAVEM